MVAKLVDCCGSTFLTRYDFVVKILNLPLAPCHASFCFSRSPVPEAVADV